MSHARSTSSNPNATASAHKAAAVFHAAACSEFQEEDFLYDTGRPQEECGVFGIYAPGIEVARRTFFGIFALQHRGQESAGIAVSDRERIRHYSSLGLVSLVFTEDVLKELPGEIAVGHNRYSTTGGNSSCNTQPILLESSDGPMALAHNGNLVNARELRQGLEARGVVFSTTMDTEIMAKLIEEGRDKPLEEALLDMMAKVSGAYSVVMMTKDTLIAMRDPNGLRPLCLGKMIGSDDGYVVASETCALAPVGAELIREIEPGEIVFINGEGVESIHFIGDAPGHSKRHSLCVFEFIYLARPDSHLLGTNVHAARRRMGELLSKQAPV